MRSALRASKEAKRKEGGGRRNEEKMWCEDRTFSRSWAKRDTVFDSKYVRYSFESVWLVHSGHYGSNICSSWVCCKQYHCRPFIRCFSQVVQALVGVLQVVHTSYMASWCECFLTMTFILRDWISFRALWHGMSFHEEIAIFFAFFTLPLYVWWLFQGWKLHSMGFT